MLSVVSYWLASYYCNASSLILVSSIVEDKSACIMASGGVDIVCSVLRLLVESAARLRLSLGAAAQRGRRLCGFWDAVVIAVAVSVSMAVGVALSVPVGVSSC
jgi:hypothetical protein